MLARIWGKTTLICCWWECKLGQPLWKIVWRDLKKLKIELLYDSVIPFLGIRNISQVTTKAPAHPCLLQYCSQKPSYGNSEDAPLLLNGLKNVVFIYNGISFSHKEE
jgi:hypothetical protein